MIVSQDILRIVPEAAAHPELGSLPMHRAAQPA